MTSQLLNTIINEIVKHLPGQHNQADHAGKGEKKGPVSYRTDRAAEGRGMAFSRLRNAKKMLDALSALEPKSDRERTAVGNAIKNEKRKIGMANNEIQAWDSYEKGGPAQVCENCGKDYPLSLVSTRETLKGLIPICRDCSGDPATTRHDDLVEDIKDKIATGPQGDKDDWADVDYELARMKERKQVHELQREIAEMQRKTVENNAKRQEKLDKLSGKQEGPKTTRESIEKKDTGSGPKIKDKNKGPEVVRRRGNRPIGEEWAEPEGDDS